MRMRYLCRGWQDLLKQTVRLVNEGYYYYHVQIFPKNKDNKYKKIDQKLIEKYQIDKNKDQRKYRKRKGLANFFYLRWERIAIIFHTQGEMIEEGRESDFQGKFYRPFIEQNKVKYDDDFSDIRYRPMILAISDEVSFQVQLLNKKGKGKKATFSMTNEMFRNVRAEIEEYIENKRPKSAVNRFNMLNNLPVSRGVIIQKRDLYRRLLKYASKSGLKINKADLFIRDKEYNKDSRYVDE